MIIDYILEYYFNIKSYVFISLIITIIFYFNNKNIFIYIIAILYDLLFSRVLFINLIIFYLLNNLITYLKSRMNINLVSYLIVLVLNIFFYIMINNILLLILNL